MITLDVYGRQELERDDSFTDTNSPHIITVSVP
jgi:hypothetical protein